MTAPFQRLAQAADADGEADSAAYVKGPPEATRAARALDAMRRRLQAHLQDRTAMMAAIAHDLRTPLTGLRLRVEALPGSRRDDAVTDIGRMERMISQLLAYVRGEEASWIEEPVDLADLARDCVRRQQAAGHAITLKATGEYIVMGDRDQLDRALSNLVENALFHGTRAELAVFHEDGDIVCTIDDDGPGIPADQIEAAFVPFHRLESSRNRDTGGAGLGLAITRSVIHRAGGQVLLENQPDGGLRARFWLPRLSIPLAMPKKSQTKPQQTSEH